MRLKRQLADLEEKIDKAEKASQNRRENKTALVKKELEMMLDYKRRELRELEEGGASVEGGKSIKVVREDLEMVRQQVDALEQHLRSREDVLRGLQAEIEGEKSKK